MPTTLVRQLSAFVYTTTLASIPKDIREIARQHFLDTLGCCLSAIHNASTHSLASYLLSEQGAPQATAIGIPQLLPAPQAAFMNGLLARANEFDDMAMPDLHPSGVIIPAVLALSEFTSQPGAAVITAITLGLELCIRLGRAGVDPVTKNSLFLQRGQDSTAICGVLAGAAVGAKLLGLDQQGIANAMGIAVSLASGSLEANRSGGNIKQFQSGWAAKSAVTAALLARHGVTGPEQALEGRYGFYQCFLDGHYFPDVITSGLGSDWAVTSLRYKPYPANYYTHAGIDAALALRRKGLKTNDITAIQLAVAKPMLRTMGEPLDRKQQPRNAYESKFSGPYTVASALIGGSGLGLGIADFTDELAIHPDRQTLMKRMTVISDDRCDAIFPDHAPAILTITTRDGKKWIEEVFVNRGSMDNPLSENEIEVKFKSNAQPVLPPEVIDNLITTIQNMENKKDIHRMTELLRIPKQSIL